MEKSIKRRNEEQNEGQNEEQLKEQIELLVLSSSYVVSKHLFSWQRATIRAPLAV